MRAAKIDPPEFVLQPITFYVLLYSITDDLSNDLRSNSVSILPQHSAAWCSLPSLAPQDAAVGEERSVIVR